MIIFLLLALALFVFLIFTSYIRARSRMHYANERRAERQLNSGEKHVPSWADDKNENEIFIEAIQKVAIRKGVPQAFLWAVLGDKDTFKSLVYLAGAMERQGESFIGQQLAVVDKLVALWENAPQKVKTACRAETSRTSM